MDPLYEELTSYENIYLAYRKAARGKRGQPPVAAFAYDEEEGLFELQRELADMRYQPGAYTSFYILDPKRRLVEICLTTLAKVAFLAELQMKPGFSMESHARIRQNLRKGDPGLYGGGTRPKQNSQPSPIRVADLTLALS